MEKNNLDITTNKMASADPALCQLSVLINSDGLAWLVADERSEALALKSWEFVLPTARLSDTEPLLRKHLFADPVFQQKWSSVRWAYLHRTATLVPNRLFNAGELPTYFQLLVRQDEPLDYFFDDLPELDAKLVFAVEPNIHHLQQQMLPAAKVQHAASGMLRQWQRLARRNDFEVFLHLRNQHGQVAVFDRKNLQFFNSFHFIKASDCFYFVMLAFDQFRLNPQETPLTISGELLDDSEIFRLIYRYIRLVRFVETPHFYHLPPAMEALPPHFNFDLFCLKF